MSVFRRVLAWIAWSAALVSFAGCDGRPEVIRDYGAALSSSFQVDPSGQADFLVDFGNLVVGDRKEVWIDVTNRRDFTLVVSGERPAKPFGHDIPQAGLTIEGESTSGIRFDFEPSQGSGERLQQQIIKLRTNEGNGQVYLVRLLGSAVPASLDCEPSSLDFGLLPQGSSRTLTAVCRNQLSAPLELKVDWFRVTGDQQRSFSSRVDGAVDERVKLDVGATVRVQVIFAPQSRGGNLAALEIGDPRVGPLATVQLAGEGVEGAVRVQPNGCLNFGEIALGERATRTISLRNLDTKPFRFVRISIPEADRRELFVSTQVPFDVPADGATRDVEIVFHPARPGPLRSSIEFHADAPGSEMATVTVCVEGYGGGASLICSGGPIDFNAVAVGMTARESYTCFNAGDEKESTVAPLMIEGLVSTTAVFSAKIVNDDGTEGPKPTGYIVGESFRVEVLYSPTAEGIDAGDIVLLTGTAPGGTLASPVIGRGRDLPPCDFSPDSSLLPFGVVAPGESLTRVFGIRNNLETSCLVYNLRLTAESAEGFAVTPIRSVELRGYEVLKVRVTFAPSENSGPAFGALEYQISNVDKMHQRVELTGTSATACIQIEPNVVDFGVVTPGCMTRDRWINVSNRCNAAVTIRSLRVHETSDTGSFFIKEWPLLERILYPHERLELAMVFLPREEGTFNGTVAVDVEDSAPYFFALTGVAAPTPTQTDTFDWEKETKVDVLWVIDNSGSFASYQDRIAQNLPSFLDGAAKANADFRIAVTTSGLTPSGFLCPGGANGGEDGRFFPIDGSRPRILTPTTLDLESHWASNMRVGTCHGTERHIEAAYRALSSPLIDERKSSRHESTYNDGNAGFLRREAPLSLIFVADEPDQSTIFGQTIQDYLASFRSLKKESMIRIHAISGSKSTETSSCGLQNGDRFHYLIDETEGTWIDICTPIDDMEAWANRLKNLSEGVFNFPTTFFLRGSVNDRTGDGNVTEDDVELLVDGDRLPPGDAGGEPQWAYDPVSNSIRFTESSSPSSGAKITATYQVACTVP